MPKGIPQKKYSGEFKIKVVETMRAEHLSCPEAANRFGVQSKTQVARWERIYLEEGTELFHLEKFDSVEQPEKAIVEYIDYYNNRRIKLKLNGLSPVQYRIQTVGAA
ncbi:MAG: IS3 family transposase [Faecalibacterium prausnitzii]|jgi:transposase InsO family protein|nr:IS3 family transposase [Faecalibacterium prausnitzii]